MAKTTGTSGKPHPFPVPVSFTPRIVTAVLPPASCWRGVLDRAKGPLIGCMDPLDLGTVVAWAPYFLVLIIIKLINIKIFVSYIYLNLLISNSKLDLEYLLYTNPPHSQSYDELYDLVAKSTVYDTLPSNRLDRFIYKLTHEDEQYTREIQILINDLLEKRGIKWRDRYYLDILEKWYFSANFDFIDNNVFNWSISVYYSKISKIQEVKDLANKIEK